ncbi:MAG: 5-(carboxyamino)imidazole ribonucleotide mutase [Thermoflavifilum aggregans]|nr:5-(carboxyamino)imidazole ribonucleotide mutase [Thermoflavifilum aggregans]
MNKPLVSIIMGSDSDWEVMQPAGMMLEQFGVPYEADIVSAHRTPDKMFAFARTAHERGIRVIIAGAGGAAHLPGMVAAVSPLPVIGVPVKTAQSLDGWDAVLSILQMPAGVPVATVALNNARNAGILAVQILASHDQEMLRKVQEYKARLKQEVEQKAIHLQALIRAASQKP